MGESTVYIDESEEFIGVGFCLGICVRNMNIDSLNCVC